MQNTVDFIDAIKARLSLPSDYAVAKVLEIKPQSIYSYRAKREFFGAVTAIKAAGILDLPPGYILACVAAEREKRPQVRRAWEKAAKALQNTAATAFIGVFALMAATSPAVDGACYTLRCILCQIRRVWLKRPLLPAFVHFPLNRPALPDFTFFCGRG